MEQQERKQWEEHRESDTPKPEFQNITIKPVYNKKMEEPQKYYSQKDWKAFKEFFKKNPKALLEPFDLGGNTVIHIATRSNNLQLLRELLELVPEFDRWSALRKLNRQQATAIHALVYCSNVEIVDLLLSYDKQLKPPPDGEEIEPEEKERPLLEFRNDIGETPFYRAAKRGNLKVLKAMANLVTDMEKHFRRDSDKTSILQIAIIGQYFDVAVWLSKSVKGIDQLAQEKNGNGLTCLQLLSRMPSVFRSCASDMEFMQELIYAFLPEQEYEDFDDDKILTQRRDLENAKNNVKEPKVLSRSNYAIWKFMAKEWDGIDRIWKTKNQHNLVEQLVDFLVGKDCSWQNSTNVKPRKEVVLPIIQPSNVAPGKKMANLERSQSIEYPIHSCFYTPLLLAASAGIVEIVKRIIDQYPQAMYHVSEDQQNVLHVAVKHRQKAIFELLKGYDAMNHLASQMSNSNKGRTLLHQAARMDYFNGGNRTGIVFQLQDELRWFERVKKEVPPSFILYCNDDNLTARELFEIEHADMLKEAKEWIKGTAQSCSAVAALITTVVFAAAYTIPGGTDDQGIPKFLNSPLFLFFTIADIMALASSLVSVMMFLSILTSPFEMNDFHKSLPQKLTLGFTSLFFSLATTMLVFGSTILLTIRLKEKWTSSLIYSVTFFPVTLLGLTQFPIYMAISYRLKWLWKTLGKLAPRRFTN